MTEIADEQDQSRGAPSSNDMHGVTWIPGHACTSGCTLRTWRRMLRFDVEIEACGRHHVACHLS